MPRRVVVTLAVAAILAIATASWWFTRVQTVPALVVHAAPLVRTLQFSARVATASRVDVGATITGRVVQVSVDEGASIKRGALLARLERDELAAALGQAQASERQAEARLAGLRSTGRSAAKAALDQAEAVLANAHAELKRAQDLVAQGFVSASRLDDALRAVAVAQSQRDSARAQAAANADAGTDVMQAQAQLALARAATETARARLAQTELAAPADARVLHRAVEPGQIVQPGRALFTLALAGPLQLEAQVDERYLEQLRVGQSATVVADAFPDQRFAARVQSIAPLVDAQRGAVEVKFALPEVPAFLREDMTLSVEVETARVERALGVPSAALRGEPNGAPSTVLVERDGHAEERAVKLGLRTLDAAEVREGLRDGDTVLLAGSSVAPGRRVRVDTSAAAVALAKKRKADDAASALISTIGR